MSILEKHLAFVNEQTAFHQKMAERFADNSFRQKLHNTTKEKFEALAKDLVEADKMLDRPEQLAPPRLVRLSLTPEDLEGLPEELLSELSIDSDKTEFAILSLIDESGGVISLDQLLVGLFRKTKEVHKRQTLTSRLYRMAQNKLVFNVPNKKGVYSTRPLTEEEFLKILGSSQKAHSHTGYAGQHSSRGGNCKATYASLFARRRA
jgi:hypothetical protein